ncbi:hypothetical protein M2283_002554 [Streptomyces pseudovenezuelae]|uniref:Uncharacterized protein n=1 Tax=Streptomyces pseudovenezuelae TaxID=67350 RepID=A0ABT6LG36_9ACTN|nr:hypothetical protein [Streptomyces pseudovenezuelae]
MTAAEPHGRDSAHGRAGRDRGRLTPAATAIRHSGRDRSPSSRMSSNRAEAAAC